MFYINNFFKTLWDLKLRGIAFLLITTATFVVVNERSHWRSYLLKQTYQQTGPYFNALIEGEADIRGIERKLQRLPGVKKVQIVQSSEVENDIIKAVKDLDKEMLKQVFSVKYQGIKVLLSNQVNARGQELIQEYLGRLVGKEKVSISQVKTPQASFSAKKGLRLFLLKGGDWYFIILLSIIWSFACYTMAQRLKTRSFLLEKFQRKNAVALRSYLMGLLVTLLPTAIYILYWENGFNYESLILVILFSFGAIINSKKIKLSTI